MESITRTLWLVVFVVVASSGAHAAQYDDEPLYEDDREYGYDDDEAPTTPADEPDPERPGDRYRDQPVDPRYDDAPDDDRRYRRSRAPREDRRRPRARRRGDRGSAPVAPAASAVDNQRVFWIALGNFLSVRFLTPLLFINYLVGPFAGALLLNNVIEAEPVRDYETGTKLLAALATFGADVVGYLAVGAIVIVVVVALSAIGLAAYGSPCAWSTFLLLGLIPFFLSPAAGAWVMERYEDNPPLGGGRREPPPRRRRRRGARPGPAVDRVVTMAY